MVVTLSPWLTKPTAAPDQKPPTSGRVDFDGLTPGQAYLVTANAVGKAGLTAAPLDAMPDVVRRVHYRCRAPGGYGAFRDFAEWILNLRGYRGADA